MRNRAMKKRNNRKGATMVEFAVVSPIVFLFFFAAFEFCRASMIQHTVDNAVYEAARTGIIPGATAGEVRQEATRIMATIGVNNATINVIPSSITEDTEQVTVRIRVSVADNSFVPVNFMNGKTVTRELTMVREGK